MGKNEAIVSFYSDLVVVQINHLPLVCPLSLSLSPATVKSLTSLFYFSQVVNLFAEEEDANVGLLMSVSKDLKKVLEPLRKSIAQMDDNNQRD